MALTQKHLWCNMISQECAGRRVSLPSFLFSERTSSSGYSEKLLFFPTFSSFLSLLLFSSVLGAVGLHVDHLSLLSTPLAESRTATEGFGRGRAGLASPSLAGGKTVTLAPSLSPHMEQHTSHADVKTWYSVCVCFSWKSSRLLVRRRSSTGGLTVRFSG